MLARASDDAFSCPVAISDEISDGLNGIFDSIRMTRPGDRRRMQTAFNESVQLRRLGFIIDLSDLDRPICRIPRVEEYHRGGVGLPAVNGGISSALCDLAIGVTGMKYLDSGRIATARLNIKFLQPLVATSVTARSWVRAVRGNRLFSAAEVANEQGIVCVKATGVVATGIRGRPE